MSTEISLLTLRVDGLEIDIQTLVQRQDGAALDLGNIFPRLASVENRAANNRWRIDDIEVGLELLPSLIDSKIANADAAQQFNIDQVAAETAAATAEVNAAKLAAAQAEVRYQDARDYIDATTLASNQEIQNQFQTDLFNLNDQVTIDIASSKNQLQANIDGVSATVTTHGAAIATIEGNAAAGYLIKAQVGDVVSLLDLIAADGSGGPVSVAKISATNILLEGSVNATSLSTNSVTADKISAGAVTANKISVVSLSAISGNLGSLQVGSANIADVIQSNNFSTGVSGWQIKKDGTAEFNGVVLSRQIEVDTGVFILPTYINDNNANSLDKMAEYWIETNTPISAWQGTKETFLALVGREEGSGNGFVAANTTNVSNQPQNVQWGWGAKVVPITRWSGDQRLWIKVELYTRLVDRLENFKLRWRLIKVT